MGMGDSARAKDIIVGRAPLYWTIKSKSENIQNIRSHALEKDWAKRGLYYDALDHCYRCNVNRLEQIEPLIHECGDDAAKEYLKYVVDGIEYSNSATLDTIDHETFLDERRSTCLKFEHGKKLLRFKSHEVTWIMSSCPEDWADYLDERQDSGLLNWVYLSNTGAVKCWGKWKESVHTGKHFVVLTRDDFKDTSDVWATLGGATSINRVVFDRLWYEEYPDKELPIRFAFSNTSFRATKDHITKFLCLFDQEKDPLKKTHRPDFCKKSGRSYGFYMEEANGYFDVFRICLGPERFYPFTRTYFKASTFHGKTFDRDLENVLRNNFYFDFKEV